MHKCSDNYCMAKSGNCRFKFPKNLQNEEFVMKIQDDKDYPNILIQRNNRYVNNFNEDILLRCRSNMDIQKISNPTSVVQYICLYITKKEPKEKNLQNM